MPELQVINDVPEELTLAAGKVTSRIQIAKTGVFKDPRYGTFKITLSDFQKWIKNFNDLNKADDRLGLPIDVDHRPETQGNTEAAGWVTGLTVDGQTLWATAEWNDLGQELVKNKRYAYISPSYVANYKDEHGKEHGTALLGVALTNRPFLSMATVSLSKLHNTTTESYIPDEMPFPVTILNALGLGADAEEATVLSKITELLAKPEPQTKTLADMAKAEGMMLLTADNYATLAQQAAEGSAAAASLKEQRFELAFTTALNDPKGARVVPAQKDDLKKLYDVDADTCISLIASFPSVVNAQPGGSGGDSLTVSLSKSEVEDFDIDEDMVNLDRKAQELMTADSNLDYGKAVQLAASQMGIS